MAKRIILTQKQLDEIVGGDSSYLDSLGTDFRNDGTNAVYTGEKRSNSSDDKPITTDKVAQTLPRTPYFYRSNTRASYFESKKGDWKKKNLKEANETNISIDPTTQNNMVAASDSAGANAVKNGNISHTNATTIKSRMKKLKGQIAKGDTNALNVYNKMGGDVLYDKLDKELKNKSNINNRNKENLKNIGIQTDTRTYGNGQGHHSSDSVITPWVNESRSIKSQKLQDILKQHGGFYKDSWFTNRKVNGDIRMTNADIHNLTDEQVIGVVDYDKVKSAIDNIRRNKLYGYVPGDDIDQVLLSDGKYLLLRIINANEYPSRIGEKGEFKQHFDKRQERYSNNQFKGKHNDYYRWHSKDAEDLAFKNPYYKEWKDDSKEQLRRKIKDDYKKQ